VLVVRRDLHTLHMVLVALEVVEIAVVVMVQLAVMEQQILVVAQVEDGAAMAVTVVLE
jgi:hypothetical protein